MEIALLAELLEAYIDVQGEWIEAVRQKQNVDSLIADPKVVVTLTRDDLRIPEVRSIINDWLEKSKDEPPPDRSSP